MKRKVFAAILASMMLLSACSKEDTKRDNDKDDEHREAVESVDSHDAEVNAVVNEIENAMAETTMDPVASHNAEVSALVSAADDFVDFYESAVETAQAEPISESYTVVFEWTNFSCAQTPELYCDPVGGESTYPTISMVSSDIEENSGTATFEFSGIGSGNYEFNFHSWGEHPQDDVCIESGTVTIIDTYGNRQSFDYEEDWQWVRDPTGAHHYQVFTIVNGEIHEAGYFWN